MNKMEEEGEFGHTRAAENTAKRGFEGGGL